MVGEGEIPELEWLRHALQVGPHLMWFLGAGASRSSGLPTATDITWDLKRKYYCGKQNQDIQTHDISNQAIRARIQGFMDSSNFPTLGDRSEYSFYFKLTFGDDYAAQQKYLREMLSTSKIASAIGHRILAALLFMGRARVVFTTNFDAVIEAAYASMSGRDLAAFHLEGSYAALDALNADQFPLYAKLHGDFRYRSVKNLADDLIRNDEQIQKCFIAAAARFGMIVSGYSGRDENVMSMFRRAMDQNNAFPHGLFWTAPRLSEVSSAARGLLEYAKERGIRCGLVQTGTFDEMLSKLWRQTEKKPAALDDKVRSAAARTVSIALPSPGGRYPILRTNALLITKAPTTCGVIEHDGEIDIASVKAKMFELQPDCAIAYTDRLLFWGASQDVRNLVDGQKVRAVDRYGISNIAQAVGKSGFVKSMVEETIARAMLREKPINLRRQKTTWYAVVKHDRASDEIYKPLTLAIGKGALVPIHGQVPGTTGVHWGEAVAIRMEERDGRLWLLMRPDIWISPLKERENATDFLRERKLKRYNPQSFDVLSAWIQILLGGVGQGQSAKITAFPHADFSAEFEISTRTAYSRRIAVNG
jgi:hypothetical protein